MDDNVVTVVSHVLPAIAEDRPLDAPDHLTSVNYADDYDGTPCERAVYDERSPLLQDGGLSRSYAEQSMTASQTTEISTWTRDDCDDASRFESSVMTDYQASLFLPSLQLSFHSNLRRPSDVTGRRYTQTSMVQTRSVALSLLEKLSDDRGSSLVLAVLNILPCLLGAAVFSLPFSILSGGYVSVAAIVLLTILTAITSHLVVDCLYEVSPNSKRRKRVRSDYLDIASGAFGRRCATVVKYALLFYFYVVNVVLIVLLGQSATTLLLRWTTAFSQGTVTCLCCLTLLPTMFVTRLSVMAYLSMVAVLATMTGFLSAIAVCFSRIEVWHSNAPQLPLIDPKGLPLAISLLLYTFLPHPIVSQIEGSMRQPHRFGTAMGISLAVSSLLKIAMALLGALSFGSRTNSLVSLNIASDSNVGGLVLTIAICLLVIFSYPLNIFVLCDAFDTACIPRSWSKWQKGSRYHLVWIALTRPLFIAATLGPALVLHQFSLLVGVVGSVVSTLFAFFLPCLFHLKLKWKQLRAWQIVAELCVMVMGVAIGLTGLYASSKALAKAT